jgi:multidrug efflux pump subunit AcrB
MDSKMVIDTAKFVRESLKEVVKTFVLALLLVLLVVYLFLQSARATLIPMLAIPLGLMAKNAILIVEFAKVRVDKGMEPVQAAIEAATIRLRPILMTSLAFIIGCIPLAIATGAGAGARKAMGTTVVGGMLTATVLGIFLIPVLFIVIEKITATLNSFRQQIKLR